MATRGRLRALSDGGLSVINGFLVPKLVTRAIGVLAAFHILRDWYLYGFPENTEFQKFFKLSCNEQRKEIIIALRHHFHFGEIDLAKELAEKLILIKVILLATPVPEAVVEQENYSGERMEGPVAAWLQAESQERN